MSPRTAAEVERSLEANRAQLQRALDELRLSARRASDIKAHTDRYSAQVRSHAEHYSAQAREQVHTHSDQLTAGALAVGFITGGGASGALTLPLIAAGAALQVPSKIVGVTLGRPTSRSRLETAMRQDKYSRQLGRALASLAAADRHMRNRKSGLWRLLRPTPRRLLLLGSAGGGVFMAMTDEQTRQNVQSETNALLDTVRHQLTQRIDTIGK